MDCSECGTSNISEARFCVNCGAELPLASKTSGASLVAAAGSNCAQPAGPADVVLGEPHLRQLTPLSERAIENRGASAEAVDGKTTSGGNSWAASAGMAQSRGQDGGNFQLAGRPLSTVAAILALAAVYFGAGKFGLSLAFVNASASAVWPPSGLAFAALLLWGGRLWPGVFLGAFLVNITTQGSLATTLGIAMGNTLEALVGAWLVRRYASGSEVFARSADIFRFVPLAALSTALSATLGVAGLCLGGIADWSQYEAIWLTWWLGDLVSDLTIAPLVIIWGTRGFSRLKTKEILEGVGLLLAVCAGGYVLFIGTTRLSAPNCPLGYMVILPLVWAGFRFGERGAVACALVTSGIALWGTLHGLGPFIRSNANESLVFLQVFMGTSTLTALLVASLLAERTQAEAALRESQLRHRAILESERLRDREISYLRQIQEEKQRSEDLLHVILPPDVAAELKATSRVQPCRFDNVGVLFCDVVGFTEYCEEHPPEEVLTHLQGVIEAFEEISARHGLEKIKTIGDCFMGAIGLRTPAVNPALSCVACGLDMISAALGLPPHWQLRVGVQVGPVVAGVVGHRKYQYDLWGDTVNMAARMAKAAEPGSVCVSADTWRLLGAHPDSQPMGRIEVKGKGALNLFRIG
jgi:class 3 adenylate cyclase/integral membrane sensor domain MASE1